MRAILLSYGYSSNFNKDVILRHTDYAAHFDFLHVLILSKDKKKIVFSESNLKIESINSSILLFNLFKLSIRLNEIIKKEKIDIISCQDFYLTGMIGVLFKFIFKIGLHIQNHSSYLSNQKYWSKKSRLFTFLIYFAKKIVIKYADRLRVVNDIEKEYYIKKLNLRKEVIDVAPVPIKVQNNILNRKDLIEEFKTKYNIKTDFIIGWAGRFVIEKNLELLFRIIASLKRNDITLVLAGSTDVCDYNLSDLENKYKLKPVYTGFLIETEKSIFYSSIDLYISTSKVEGFGVSVLESLLYEKPVISTENSGAKMLITNNENGYIINENDISKWIDTINCVLPFSVTKKRNFYFNKIKNLYNYENMVKEVADSIKKTKLSMI